MLINKNKILSLVYLVVFTLVFIYIYEDYITVANEYEGFNNLNFSFSFLFSAIIICLLLVYHIPMKLVKPSDFYLTFYLIIVVYSNFFFSSGLGYLESSQSILLLLLLYFPVIFFVILRKYKFRLNFKYLFSNKIFIISIVIFSVLAAFQIYNSSSHIGSFGFLNSYERRLSGREIFSSGMIISYIISILFNTIAPFLAFYSSLKSNRYTLVISLLLCILSYWSIGLKSVFLYVFIFYLIGLFLNRKNFIKSNYIFISVLALSLIILMEYFITNQSFIAQLMLRRIFFVGAKLQNMYFDAFSNLPYSELFFGKNINNFSDVTYFIGEEYIDNPLTNANTNTYLYFLLKFGFIGYFINVFVVSGIFLLLDSIYLKNKSYIALFTGMFFAILICESSFTTSLFTSGLLFFIILSFFTNPKSI